MSTDAVPTGPSDPPDPAAGPGPSDTAVDADPADLPVEEVTDEDLTPLRGLSQADRQGEELVPTDPLADDPDLLAVQESLSPDDPHFLATDTLTRGGDTEEGWEPPDELVVLEEGETMEEKLAAEVPEPDPRAAARADAAHDLLET